MVKDKIRVIGFDADDTLWVNEPYYKEAEAEFTRLMTPYNLKRDISGMLFNTEMANLDLYGYWEKDVTTTHRNAG